MAFYWCVRDETTIRIPGHWSDQNYQSSTLKDKLGKNTEYNSALYSFVDLSNAAASFFVANIVN